MVSVCCLSGTCAGLSIKLLATDLSLLMVSDGFEAAGNLLIAVIKKHVLELPHMLPRAFLHCHKPCSDHHATTSTYTSHTTSPSSRQQKHRHSFGYSPPVVNTNPHITTDINMAPAIKPTSRASAGWAAASQSDNTAKQHVPYQETHRIRCTKPDCEMLFATEKQMRKHKRDDPEHFYCYKCDVDCDDWEDLTRHKVDMMAPYIERRIIATPDDMPKHIVCEFCGEDFKSIGGRKLHRETVESPQN